MCQTKLPCALAWHGGAAPARVATLPLLGTLSYPELKQAQSALSVERFAAGEVLVEYGAVPGRVFLLTEGACVMGHEKMHVGSWFGAGGALLAGVNLLTPSPHLRLSSIGFRRLPPPGARPPRRARA